MNWCVRLVESWICLVLLVELDLVIFLLHLLIKEAWDNARHGLVLLFDTKPIFVRYYVISYVFLHQKE